MPSNPQASGGHDPHAHDPHGHHPGCQHPSPEVMRHTIKMAIKKHGFSCVGILPTEKTYTYSVGLMDSLDHPELVVVGIDSHVGMHVIQDVHAALKRGDQIPLEERVTGLLGAGSALADDLPVRLESVNLDDTWLRFFVMRDYYGPDRELRVVQVVVPDDRNKLPGEEGCDPFCAEVQSLTGRP
jgi:hypothetical protein